MHRLGFPVRLVAEIGADPLGSLVLERVRAQGAALADGLTVLPGDATSYSIVLSPPGVDRIFLHCPGVNDTFTGDEIADRVLQGAALFHFGYPPLMRQIWSDGGVRLARLLARAQRLGSLTSLDMSLPDPSSPSGRADWRSFLDRVLPSVDMFVPSIEELLFMLDRRSFERLSANGGGEAIINGIRFDELDALAEISLARGVSAILIKLGDRGAYLRTAKAPFPRARPSPRHGRTASCTARASRSRRGVDERRRRLDHHGVSRLGFPWSRSLGRFQMAVAVGGMLRGGT